MADTNTPSKEALEAAAKHVPHWEYLTEKDQIAHAVALDAFAAPYKSRAEAVERALEDEQKAHLSTVDQRDEAEDAVSQIYTAVTGRMPEWSNAFCYLDALHDVEANITACFAEAEAEKAKRDGLTAQVAALREVVGGLIALIQETANHDHQASDWGVFVRDARTALADTQATAARVIREAEARGMEMAAEWHREQARQLEILPDAKFRNAQSTAYTEHVGSAHILREAAARHRAGTSEGEAAPGWWCPTCKQSVAGQPVQ